MTSVAIRRRAAFDGRPMPYPYPYPFLYRKLYQTVPVVMALGLTTGRERGILTAYLRRQEKMLFIVKFIDIYRKFLEKELTTWNV